MDYLGCAGYGKPKTTQTLVETLLSLVGATGSFKLRRGVDIGVPFNKLIGC